MSKRTKKQNNQPANTPVSTDSASDAAVIEAAVETTVETPVEAEITDDVLAAIANDDAVTAETIEPVVDEDVLAALAADESDAPATTTDSDEPVVTADDVDEPTEDEVLAAIDASGKKTRKAREPKTPAAPAREFTAVAQIDEDTLKANLEGCNAKKVKEKAENLIATITHGKKLSRYTSVAVNELLTNGRFSGKSMTERFRAEGLSDGTARAQAQQMTALFKLVGAAHPDPSAPKELIVADNDLVQELAKAAA